MVETPVLFITFVRSDYARQTFDAIKAAKPKKLYFYSNKGREEKDGEIERNEEIRGWANEIDWDCECHTFFRDHCVNVYDSLRGAISWLFENEECGIVLEEDCVPTKAFFSFCDQMIARFRDEKKVWYVSGDNFYNLNPSGYDFIFSRYHWMYGWASWRDRWNSIAWGDFGIQEILDNKLYNQLFKSKRQCRSRKKQILGTKDMVLQTDCWDYALGYTVDQNLGFGVFPKEHLIHNIGLTGTHNKLKETSFVNTQPTYKSETYIINNPPITIEADLEFDFQYYKVRRKQRTVRERGGAFLRFFLKDRYVNIIKGWID